MTSFEWEGLHLKDVIATTGTPALIASERRLRENIRELRRGLESAWPSVLLRYCVKTNSEMQLLRIIAEEGMHALAAHSAEARLALVSGFSAAQIAYQRPVLEAREIEAVFDAGVRRFHAFRHSDLDLLSNAAIERNVELRVSVRVALGRRGMFALTAASSRLGMMPDDVVRIGAARPNIVIDALNTYIGTQQEHASAYRPAIRELARLAVRLRSQGHPIEEINLGGGIPSNSIRRLTVGRLLSRGNTRFIEARSPADYATELGAIAAEEIRRADPKFTPRLVFEPGRSIVGNAVVLLTRILAEQKQWRFLDCGRNVLVESPLAFTRWIAPLHDTGSRPATVNLSGPTLNTLDVVELRRVLPAVHAGDVLVIGDAGAYTVSRSTRYAGLGPALWLARGEGKLACIRRADSYGDLIAPMRGALD